jgi:5-methylcytosine-specific restriction endonuclease McrA
MAKKKRKWNVKSLIIGQIRKTWLYSPLRREVVKRAKVSMVKGVTTYRCEKCRKLTEKVQIDHILPAICPQNGWQGFDSFIERTFCDPTNLQALCVPCHLRKSLAENLIRKQNRNRLTK